MKRTDTLRGTLVYFVYLCSLLSGYTQTDISSFQPYWYALGNARGGRATCIQGIPDQPFIYYMGTAGGGVWKTENAGNTWFCTSDSYLQTASIGALAIAPSNPDILVVGTGESAIRAQMTFEGDGVYRSDDQGKSWRHIGLQQSFHISAIQIHPINPDIIWVAAQGNPFQPNEHRGIYKTTDGGKTWKKTLYLSPTTGASGLSINPRNPDILYAGTWDHQRTPWSIQSGGKGSGLYISKNAGDTWTKLEHGLPADMGKTDIAVSPAAPNRVYALIEGNPGGVFCSMDGGRSWKQQSAQRNTITRAWYYTKLIPHPVHVDELFVMNIDLLHSTDGGKFFQPLPIAHPDQHALWINPKSPQVLALANDGGATISLDGGKNWSSQQNQPTGQFYRLHHDPATPDYVYASQQDYDAVRIRLQDGTEETIGPCESSFIATQHTAGDSLHVYTTCYQGNLYKWPEKTNISPDQSLKLGKDPKDFDWRFNWSPPLLVTHQKNLFMGAQYVLKSADGGKSWEESSPLLTKVYEPIQQSGDEPFTFEGAGGEVFHTISYLAKDPKDENTIWAGTDDGLLHISRDHGQNWTKIPADGVIPEGLVHCIEVSTHEPGVAYVVVNRHKWGDEKPYLFKIADYGKSVEQVIVTPSIPHALWSVREDPVEEGLLLLGTQKGVYYSTTKGTNWLRWGNDLPVTPVLDMVITKSAILIATGGRGLWASPDIEIARNWIKSAHASFCVIPDTVYLTPNHWNSNSFQGFLFTYYTPADMSDLQKGATVYIRNEKKEVIHTVASGLKTGLNSFYWDLHHTPIGSIETIFTPLDTRNLYVQPGQYEVVARIGNTIQVFPFIVSLYPPQSKVFPPAQLALATEVVKLLQEIQQTASLSVRWEKGLEYLLRNLPEEEKYRALHEQIRENKTAIKVWRSQVVQEQYKSYHDLIHYPGKIWEDALYLKIQLSSPNSDILSGANRTWKTLQKQWEKEQRAWSKLSHEQLNKLNQLLVSNQLPPLVLPIQSQHGTGGDSMSTNAQR